jgi:undecaprenyl-diphosphatase
MLTILHVIILGLVEGLTEFLPVSSTGHMIVASHLMQLPESEFLKTFTIFIQIGAIAAVLSVYWKKLLTSRAVFLRVCAAFIPTAVIGYVVYSFAKQYLLDNVVVVIWALLLGGIALIVFEKYHAKKEVMETSFTTEISFKQAVAIGFFQTLAIVPGVSRSAATIIGGLSLGISRTAIVEFSFLLAVPTLAAAAGLDIVRGGFSFSREEVTLLVVGSVVAFISALVAVRFLLHYIRTHSFVAFGIYRIVFALVVAGILVY